MGSRRWWWKFESLIREQCFFFSHRRKWGSMNVLEDERPLMLKEGEPWRRGLCEQIVSLMSARQVVQETF